MITHTYFQTLISWVKGLRLLDPSSTLTSSRDGLSCSSYQVT